MSTAQTCHTKASVRLSFLDRSLTLWIFLAMLLGVAVLDELEPAWDSPLACMVAWKAGL